MGTEVRLRAAVAKSIGAVKHTRTVSKDIAGRAIATDVDIVASEAVGHVTEEADSLAVDSGIKDQVVEDTASADVGYITAGAVGDVAGGALTDAAGEESGLIAGLAEAVGRARGAVDQIADIASRPNVGVNGVVVAVLAGVKAAAEGAARDVAELADSIAEGVRSQACSAGGRRCTAGSAVGDSAGNTASVAELESRLAAGAGGRGGAVGAVGLVAGEAGGVAGEKSRVADRALVGPEAGEAIVDITDITTASCSSIVE